MRFDWRHEAPHGLLLAALFAAAAWSWGTLPDSLPVHFGLDGRPDRWGGKFEALLLLPLVATALYALLLVLPRIDPRRDSYAGFAGTYAIVRLAALAVLAVIYGAMLASYREHRVHAPGVIVHAVGGLFIVLGAVMRRIRPNWFVGVRTPWTLTSAYAWERTHRIAGPVFVGGGIAFILAGAIDRAWAIVVAASILGAGIIGLVVYSYFAWRADPARGSSGPAAGPA